LVENIILNNREDLLKIIEEKGQGEEYPSLSIAKTCGFDSALKSFVKGPHFYYFAERLLFDMISKDEIIRVRSSGYFNKRMG
jgi:hypothetical protein